MQTMRTTERTGADGVLQVRIPLGQPDAEFDVVVLVKPSGGPESSTQNSQDMRDDPWTEEMNARRCQLIDQKLQGLLSADEARELNSLQDALRRHMDRVAPLPIDGARLLHAELMAKHRLAD